MAPSAATCSVRARRRVIACAAAASVALAASVASAEPSAVDREAARAFATRGFELYEQGDYPRALEFFEQAEKRFHAPPHMLYLARATAKLGKLLDARARYRKLLDEKVDKDAPAAFKGALDEARAELADVDKRIPDLAVAVRGPGADAAEITLDGASIAAGSPARALDPGSHSVVVVAGDTRTTRSIQLAEGAHARVEIELEAPIATSYALPIAGFAVGVVGLGVGAVAGALALGKGQGESPGALAPIAVAGLVVGGAGVAFGAITLALHPAPRAREPEVSTNVALSIAPGNVALTGSF